MRILSENKVVLCRRGKSCCPVVTTDPKTGGVEITDDYDGKVLLTKEEAEDLVEFLTQKKKD